MEPRLNFYAEAPELMNAQMELKKAVDKSVLEKDLIHLVNLRASQINGCSYCVDMHSREALENGESEHRLFLVSAWRNLLCSRRVNALLWPGPKK